MRLSHKSSMISQGSPQAWMESVMLSNIEEPEHESEPQEQGSDDDRQTPNTSMEMTSHNTTSSSVDDEFKFDINGSRYTPYSEIKHPTPPKESVNDNLPPYVFRSNSKLFMGGWYDITESPCLEIIEDMYESIDDVVITHTDEDKVFSTCIDSTEVKVNSVYDYTEFLMNWTELKCFRMSKGDKLK